MKKELILKNFKLKKKKKKKKKFTSLSTRKHIMSHQYCRDGPRLNRRRRLVLAQLDVLQHDGMEASMIELHQRKELADISVKGTNMRQEEIINKHT